MPNPRLYAVFWLCAVLAIAIALGSMGVVIIADMILNGANALSRVRPEFDVGVVVLVISVGLLAVVFKKRGLATAIIIPGLAATLVLTVLSGMSGGGVTPSLAVQPFLPLVIGLILTSILLTVWGLGKRLVLAVAAAICFLVSLLSMVSYWHHSLSVFALFANVELSIVASILILLASLLLPTLPGIFSRQGKVSFKRVIAVGAAGIFVTTLCWHFLRVQQSEHLLESANALAEQVEISNRLAYRTKLALIQRLAERWQLLDDRTRHALWPQEAGSYLRDFPGLKLLTLLDSDFIPIVTKARGPEYNIWLQDFFTRSETSGWLTSVTESPHASPSRPISMSDGSAHSAIAVAITTMPGKPVTILAILDLERFYEDLTRAFENGFIIRVTAYGTLVFDSSAGTELANELPLVSRVMNMHGDRQWQLYISASHDQVSHSGLILPILVLFSGIGLSFLVMLNQFFKREADIRSTALQTLNRTLNYHLDEEKALRRTNERILEFSRDILCSLSRDGTVLQISPACEQILGYTPEELLGKHYDHLLSPADRAATEEEMQRVLSGELSKSSGFCNHLYHRSGYLVTMSWTAEWSPEEQTLFCVGRDISDELAAEALSRERDQFFSLSPDIFCIIDLNSHFFEFNNTMLETLGYSREDLLGTSYMHLIHPDDQQAAFDATQSLSEGKNLSELKIRALNSDGRHIWLSINAVLSAEDLIYIVARDITEQRQIEQKLREHENLLSMAERVAMLGGWKLDLTTGQATWSDAVCAIHDLPPGQTPDVEDALDFYLPADRERITQALDTCIETGIPFDQEFQIRTAKGRVRWVRSIGHAVKNESGKIVKLQGAFQDITASRQALEQIRSLAERQSTIFESITDAFFTVDHDWRFTYVNRRSEELLQKTRHELLGEDLWEVFPGAVASTFDKHYRRAVETGESVFFEGYYEPLGHWFEVSAYPSEEGLAVYYRSINERKEAQWKLEATMAELERSNQELQDFAFVASHDLQEPLRKIQAFSDRLMSYSEDFGEREKDYLGRMHSAASRMQNLIEDLLSYSRITTHAAHMKPCDTSVILREVQQDMETSISREQAHIEVGELLMTNGDATQLRQVLQNLLSNAIKFHADNRPPHIRLYSEDVTEDEWTLVVSDNGIGFDERYAEKMFQPFQRLHQKDGYAGTGIGMAIVKKILDRHGASVTVQSIPDHGTTFRIRFSRAKSFSS